MNNPTKDKKGSDRVARGGRWNSSPNYVRPSYRPSYDPTSQNYVFGFRIVRNAS